MKAIRSRKRITDIDEPAEETEIGPNHTVITGLIFRRKKGCHFVRLVERKYRKLIDSPTPIIQKWHERLQTTISEEGWRKIFVIHRSSQLESKFQWFQVRLLQNILGTRKRMNLIRPTDYPNPLCTFCDQVPETIIHLFHECPVSAKLWDELRSWFCELAEEELTFTRLMHLFGATFKRHDDPLNVCLLITRFYIWYCKCSETLPSFSALTNYLQFYLKTLKMTFNMKGRRDQFESRWLKFLSWIG